MDDRARAGARTRARSIAPRPGAAPQDEMKRSDYIWIGILAVFVGFIWLRDLQWVAAADDLLPIVAGLPLFVWLLWPLR